MCKILINNIDFKIKNGWFVNKIFMPEFIVLFGES